MRICIDAEKFRLLQPFCSTEETRYYLRGVYVQPHPVCGVRLVATDGHAMGMFRDHSAEAENAAIVALPAAALKACKRARGDDHGMIRVLIVEGDIKAARCTIRLWPDSQPICEALHVEPGANLIGQFPATIIDGTYPEYRRVFKTANKLPRVQPCFGVNVNLLERFAPIASRNGGAPVVRLFQHSDETMNDDGGPIIVHTARTDFLGVIMPVAGVDRRGELPPDWIVELWNDEARKAEAA